MEIRATAIGIPTNTAIPHQKGKSRRTYFYDIKIYWVQPTIDAFFAFVSAKMTLRMKVLKAYDHASIPVSDLLRSNLLDPTLFGATAVSKITVEARHFHASIKGLLEHSSEKKRKYEKTSPSAPTNRRK